MINNYIRVDLSLSKEKNNKVHKYYLTKKVFKLIL